VDPRSLVAKALETRNCGGNVGACPRNAETSGAKVLRTCNGAEYQVKIFLSMPIYAFHGAILGVFVLVVTLCTVI